MTQGPDRTRLRVTALAVVFFSMFSALVLRLWFLQVLAHETYAEAAQNNQVRFVPSEPSRGRILDRNGEVLVKNRSSYFVSIRSDQLVDRKTTLSKLSTVLGMTPDQVEQKLKDRTVSPYTAVPIAQDVPEDTITYLYEHQADFAGVVSEIRPIRVYPNGALAGHLLGYVGEINSDELKKPYYKGYRAGALIGRGGIEAAYEHDLYGRDGKVKLEVDASGKVRKQLGQQLPQSGKDLMTTLDIRIQKLAEESLRLGLEKARTIFDKESGKTYAATAGGAVVLDPKTGEIIALASYPSFDPGRFIGGISRSDFDALSKDPTTPLLNRVTQAAFPPGSTFKVVTAAAALQNGVANKSNKFSCPASFRFADTTFRNWKSSDSGALTIPQALIDSCDTVFYPWGAEFYRRFKRGEGEQLQQFARDFGLGVKTGIELDERAGRVPDEAWLKEQNRRFPKSFPYSTWLPGYTINMSIGQGDVLTTPLQLADAYAAIATGGSIARPHIGMKVLESADKSRQLPASQLKKLQLNPAYLGVIRAGLEGVPTVGTARGAFVGFPFDKVSVAAKTGTAEVKTIPPKQPYAWFASYAPAKDPRYVVVVMLEEGGHGGETAAPIARRILEGLFDLPLSDITPAARTD